MIAAVLLAVLLLAAPLVDAGEIQKWVDENGRMHFSNRGGADTSPPPAAGEGWESILERQEGQDEFTRRAEAAINGLAAERRRKKRERDRANATLQTTQEEIGRAQGPLATRLPELRAREAQELAELRKLELELAQIDANVEKLRAFKAMGREQAEKLGASPLLQFGQ